MKKQYKDTNLVNILSHVLRAKYTLTVSTESAKTSWLDLKTSVYKCYSDNIGEQQTFRQIFFGCIVDTSHKWFYKNDNWVNGSSTDRETISKIRAGDLDKTFGKNTLQCYTVSACFKSKKKGAEIIDHYNPILQIDIDPKDNPTLFNNADSIEQVKAEIFSLPFVCLVSKSVSGNGLFVLILIAEPDKLEQYALHCFEVFRYYGLNPDTTKGKKYSNLRFVSCDDKLLYREHPEPLKIKKFHAPPVKECKPIYRSQSPGNLISRAIKEVEAVETGNRSNVVNKWCWVLGGHGVGLDEMIDTINNSPQYAGEEQYFINIAKYSFRAGQTTAEKDFKN